MRLVVRVRFVSSDALSLANDKTESWISDRTGHRSSAMINNYKRVARGFQELDVGALSPLDAALPELRALALEASSDQPAPVAGGPAIRNSATNLASPRGFATLLTPGSPGKSRDLLTPFGSR